MLARNAGVGTYSGTYDAQKLFDAFAPHELGITPLTFVCERSCYPPPATRCAGPSSCSSRPGTVVNSTSTPLPTTPATVMACVCPPR
jgi:sulfate adenylyltransferase